MKACYAEVGADRIKPTRPALLLRFPIKADRRLLSIWFQKLEKELRGLQHPAQETVCQIVRAYQAAPAMITSNNPSAQRRELRNILNRLTEIDESLPDEKRVLVMCEEVRSVHRPRGSPGSVREMFRVVLKDDYVSSHKEYFENVGLADPAEPLEGLAHKITAAREFLEREIALIQSQIRATQSALKTTPHLWWQGGGIYYLLDRVFREGSLQRTTQARAHKRIKQLMSKVNGTKLKFDPIKGYSPAIRSAIERMSPEYKRLCDRFLEEWLGLVPKKH